MNKQQIMILRDLAQKVAEIAANPIQEQKRVLWKKHNMLEKTRPVIFCDPENGWGEIITPNDLMCTDKQARNWEWYLRREIFWGTQMNDDRVIEPFFNIPFVSTSTGWGKQKIVHGGENGNSYTWEPMIKDYESDFLKIHFPQYSIDRKATDDLLILAKEVFEPFLSIRVKQMWWWTLGLTSNAIDFRGLEQFMVDMYDYPDELHKMMGFLCDGTINMIDSLEERGLLCANADDSYVGSGGFGYTDELPSADFNGKIRAKDMWGFCESQETVGVSPEMFNEFVFPYQLKIMEKFGLNCYGCCEILDKRWHIIQQIPNLRRVSVSPWANIETMADFLNDKYIFSMKPNPSYLASPSPDFTSIQNSLKAAVDKTKDCCVEIIMKDNNTIGGNPQNVVKWCKIAKHISESL